MSEEYFRLQSLITENLPEGIATRSEARLWMLEFRTRWVRIAFSPLSSAVLIRFQTSFMEGSVDAGGLQGSDANLQRALACSCYRLLDFITADWYGLVPELLGSLGPIVRDLPPGQTLSDTYPPPAAGNSSPTSPSFLAVAPVPGLYLPPPPLAELFAVRALLRHTSDIPSECAAAIGVQAGRVTSTREDYQRAHNAPRSLRNEARRDFIMAHLCLNSTVIDAELSIMERRSYWDRVVHLLRGDWFYYTHFNFETDEFEEPHWGWFNALSEEVQNGPPMPLF
jgi:hypothetical protein